MKQASDIEGNLDTPAPPLPDTEGTRILPYPASGVSTPAKSSHRLHEVTPIRPKVATTPLAAAPTVTFSGKIVRNGARFALRETAGVLYPLDSASRAWPFEGEDVRVSGKLDLNTRLLYVDSIEHAIPSVPLPSQRAGLRASL